MSDNEITVVIGGKGEDVDARATLELLAEAIALLGDVEAKQIAARPNLRWEITEASKSSPLRLTLRGATRHDRGTTVPVVHLFMDGLQALEEEVPIPDWLDAEMIARAKRLVRRVGTDVSSLAFSSGRRTLKVTQRVAANADRYCLPEKYSEHAEHEGQLGQITAHEHAREFCIFDRLTGRKIHCNFPIEELGRVRDALTRRVFVSGLTTYRRRDDQPLTVEVESWSLLPDDSDLPSIEEIHAMKVDLTSGRRSEDVIADLRRLNG